MISQSGPLNPEFPDSPNQPKYPQSFGIRSTNVLLDSHDEPVEAIILIQDQKIHDVILPNQKDPAFLSQLNKDWSVQDYKDLVILPGLIDSNVHLHADFDDDWENIQYCTELAAAGGVTTVIDNPVMSAPFQTGEEYVEILKKRIEKIKEKSKVDFGVLGVLEPRTKEHAGEVLAAGALGFKTYLSSCMQNTINYFGREEFETLVEELEERHPELLLMVHPEMATDREMYLTSPCRITDLKSRLDQTYEIKSIEFGGAANKGSYIDDFSKKLILDDDDEEDEEEEKERLRAEKEKEEQEEETQMIRKRCSAFAEIDSPTRLEVKIQETKEKNELNDLVHHELRSYAFEECQEAGEEDSGVDSDNEFLENMQQQQQKDNEKEEETKEKEIVETIEKVSPPKPIKLKNISNSDEDEKDEEKEWVVRKLREIGKRRSDGKLSISPLKKSLFATLNSREARDFTDATKMTETQITKKKSDFTKVSELFAERKEFLEDQRGAEEVGSIEMLNDLSAAIEMKLKPIALQDIKEGENEELEQAELNEKKNMDFDAKATEITTVDTLSLNLINTEVSKSITTSMHEELDNQPPQGFPLFNRRPRSPVGKMTPLVTSWSEPDRCHPTEGGENPPVRPGYKGLTIFLEQSPMTPLTEESPKSTRMANLSPTKGSGTPSSLLLRRGLTFKSVNQVRTPAESGASTPLAKFGSLEVVKTPESVAGKEARFNQSYRTFLANRPPSWEENAVSMVLDNIKADSKLKVVFHNLSLATSFQKIKNKKNSGENYKDRIFGDASPAYLFFSEKMVKKGETKYKVSPPFRNKENKRFLLDHFRLDAIDLISSYHFFVPHEYKQVDQGNFRRAFGGLNAMGYSLQTVWSAAYSYQEKSNPRFKDDVNFRKKTINLLIKQLYKTMCVNPSRLLKISDRKGMIAKGRDADFVIWDPYKAEKKRKLPEEHVFAGRKLMGRVCKTFLRGNVIYDHDGTGTQREHSAEFIRV